MNHANNKKMKNLSIILLLFVSSALFAQGQKDAIKALAKTDGTSILLRWAPTTSDAWEHSNEVGYQVQRFTIYRNGELLPPAVRREPFLLTPTPIKPATEAVWKELMARDNFAPIAAQAIFGKTFSSSTATNDDLLKIVDQVRERENRHGFALFSADQSYETAIACGLAFKDTRAKANEKYVYRVFPATPGQTPIDTGYTSIAVSEVVELPKPFGLKAEFADKKVRLTWNDEYLARTYSAYYVERSDDNGQTFKMVSDLPVINPEPAKKGAGGDFAFYLDELEENNKVYHFRLKGKTPFGEFGPPSDPVIGAGRPAALGVHPHVKSATLMPQNQFLIEWEFPEEFVSKVKEFKIQRADKAEGPFTDISTAPATATSYTHTNPKSTNYYRVVAVDETGNLAGSYPRLAQFDDDTPPALPTNIRGQIDSTGKMTITWTPGEEEDLLGYRVFLANNPDAEYTQITRDPVFAKGFVDSVSMNTLSKNVHIKVMAVDFRYNKSKFSAPIVVVRPDNIPPTAPVFSDLQATKEGITFSWIPSSSIDVVSYELQKAARDTEDWSTFKTYSADSINAFTPKIIVSDKEADRGVYYQYRLVVTDLAGLTTITQPIIAVRTDTGIRKPISKFEAEADRAKKAVRLTWEGENNENLTRFLIYRSIGKNGTMKEYEGIAPEAAKIKHRKLTLFEFSDNLVKMNTSYTYRVQAIYNNGARSILSQPLTVNY